MRIIGRKIRERAYPYLSNPAQLLPDLRAVRSRPIDTVISLFLSEPPVLGFRSPSVTRPGSGSAPDVSANARFRAGPIPAANAIRGPVTPSENREILCQFVSPGMPSVTGFPFARDGRRFAANPESLA